MTSEDDGSDAMVDVVEVLMRARERVDGRGRKGNAALLLRACI